MRVIFIGCTYDSNNADFATTIGIEGEINVAFTTPNTEFGHREESLFQRVSFFICQSCCWTLQENFEGPSCFAPTLQSPV